MSAARLPATVAFAGSSPLLLRPPQSLDCSVRLRQLRAAELRVRSAQLVQMWSSFTLLQPRPSAVHRELLADAGSTLHPGLALRPERADRAKPGRGRRPRVLLLCTGNSCPLTDGGSDAATALPEVRIESIGTRRQPPEALAPGRSTSAARAWARPHRPPAHTCAPSAAGASTRDQPLRPRTRGLPRFRALQKIHWSIPDPRRRAPAATPKPAPHSHKQRPSSRRASDSCSTESTTRATLHEGMMSPVNDQILVNIRYLVDDVGAGRRLLHRPARVHAHDRPRRRPSPTSCVETLRLLLSGPTSSAGRPMPDSRRPEPGGWNPDPLHRRRHRGGGSRNACAKRPSPFRDEIITGPVGQNRIVLDDPAGNPVKLFQPRYSSPDGARADR